MSVAAPVAGFSRVEQVMGTAVCLDIADPLPRAELDRLADGVFDWLREVDRRFSTYREDSEVCRLDSGRMRYAATHPDLRLVLEACEALWTGTDGYFDIHATGRLDPSGFVKGWSVQVASDRLAAAGSVNHCLNAGGDVRLRGYAPGGAPWRVGIRHPWLAHQLCWVLEGTDLAVATSGTYERGYHVVDPIAGCPARALRSVTVVGTDLGVTDAYATAALAMGEAGLAWLDRLDGHESAVVTADGRAFRSAGLPVAEHDPQEPTAPASAPSRIRVV